MNLSLPLNAQKVTIGEQLSAAFKEQQQIFVAPQASLQGYTVFRKTFALGEYSTACISTFGAYTEVGHHVAFTNSSAGNYCVISPYCEIGIGEHEMSSASLSEAMYANSTFAYHVKVPAHRVQPTAHKYHCSLMPPVTIGHDVFLGWGVLVPRQVTIGTGAIIGARAVITHDVEPFSVVVGYNRKIRQRFSDEICADLLASKWWEYDIPALIQAESAVPCEDPRAFLDFLKNTDSERLPRLPQQQRCLVLQNSLQADFYTINEP